MNYQRIHDLIIGRGRDRTPEDGVYYEKHHVIPKCEGGSDKGETVPLTVKEHALVHYLRHKITGNPGNLAAYRLNKDSGDRARQAGLLGGQKCVDEKLGFFSLTEDELRKARKKGASTLVRDKIGMFSDDYRAEHRKKMCKVVEIDDMVFDSCELAAEHYGVTPAMISYWIGRGRATIISEGEFANKGEYEWV